MSPSGISLSGVFVGSISSSSLRIQIISASKGKDCAMASLFVVKKSVLELNCSVCSMSLSLKSLRRELVLET